MMMYLKCSKSDRKGNEALISINTFLPHPSALITLYTHMLKHKNKYIIHMHSRVPTPHTCTHKFPLLSFSNSTASSQSSLILFPGWPKYPTVHPSIFFVFTPREEDGWIVFPYLYLFVYLIFFFLSLTILLLYVRIVCVHGVLRVYASTCACLDRILRQ